MVTDINHRLTQAKMRLRTKQKLDAMLSAAQQMLRDELQQCRIHEEVLAAEKADVENLEGMSLTRLFYTILGTKEKQLQKERQEYLAALLKHEGHFKAVDEARHELERLRQEVITCRHAEGEYNRVVNEKQQYLLQARDGRSATLLSLVERLADLEADRKEFQEAFEAGTTAQRALEDVRHELRSAENWGSWDMMGGGMWATMHKHSRIDSAKAKTHVAQRHLRQFQKEMADTHQRLQISLADFGGFSTFADYFFDGLIADWIVQSKITKALEACNSAIWKVEDAVSRCRRQLKQTEREITQVAAKRQQFIEQA